MSPLHSVGQLLRELLAQIPLSVVRVVFVAIPLVLMIWVLRLPTERTTPADGRRSWDVDLRVWAWLALGVQVVIYCLL
jgi:hypothetical protein